MGNFSRQYKSKLVHFVQKTLSKKQEMEANNTQQDLPAPVSESPLPEPLTPPANKKKVPLVDSLFAHVPDDRRYFDWDRNVNAYNHVFLTDASLTNHGIFNGKTKYAWMIESPEITANEYNWLAQNATHFHKVFTFKRSLLDSDPVRFKFVPGGSCWIKEQDWGIHEKTKLVSIISSNKNFTTGHQLRHRIIQRLRSKMDVFGRGFNDIPDKIEGLKDYMFSFAIENTKEDYYFTEKLIDCFMTGTVPIYYGCPSIAQFFNANGMIIIDNLAEAENMLNLLTPELYQKMLPAIRDNYERCIRQYLSYEDFMYFNYSEFLFGLSSSPSPLNDVADEVYCINLERRLDRWTEVSQQFDAHNIKVTRWLAVDGWKIEGKHHMRHGDMEGDSIKGAVGCLRSHRNAIKDALDKGHNTICVFEDDVVLQRDFNMRFTKLMSTVPKDWEMLYIGCHWHGLPNPHHIGNNIYKLNCFGVFGVLLRGRAILQKIYDATAGEEITLDDYLCYKVQPGRKVYTTIPFLVKVKEDFSDIANQFADYKIVSKYFY